ncbi:MAG TPA: type III polyketide synthase [Sphingomicrobium sp.]|nr:type III polyketide synthase [Sphingomicrobium sp.]
MDKVGLLSLATALPPYSVEQSVAKAKAREVFGGKKELFDRLASVFDNAGIAKRHIVAPTEWYEGHHGWKERNRVYLDACDALFRDAASAAIRQAGLNSSDIDGVVMVSTTGIATPSLEARNGPAIGLRGTVRRVPLFGLGCAGGVNGLATAAGLAAADPGSRWLFVTIETCSIAIRLDSDDPAAIVATAIFGDGAAAAVVGTDGDEIATIAGAGERMWPDTLNIMGWRVEDPGLAVVFDRAIPPFVEAELAGAVDGMLADMGRRRGDIDRFCCHPGGVKVIDAIESALELPIGALDLERDVLNDCGNMSAPTVLFVLERLIARGLPGRSMLTAFGPGFTCAGMMLERA